jgi:transposase
MLPHHAPAPQSPDGPPRRLGVGLDTSRYGHYAAFLHEGLQPAADELSFAESGAGYALLRQRLERLQQKHGPLHFVVRLDAAGQYADNLRHFLQQLAAPAADGAPAAFHLTLSCGDPQRNKNYRAALFGGQKSDPVEARAAARFALTEKPLSDMPMSQELRLLRQVAGRLQAVVRQRTRLINQFHHLLALTFPELALVTRDLATGWVLELVHRYPTAPLLARAAPPDLAKIPYLPDRHVTVLLLQAHTSVGSLRGATAEELVREQVRQLRDVGARQKRLENLLVSAYAQLPCDNRLATITGVGPVTAAVLTAFILDIERFETPGKLVAYFGILPIEVSSGVTREGQTRGPRRFVMSRRGNDLVRRYLWMAALSAIRHNPAVRALYARVVAKHPGHKAVAVGHTLRKLLHLAFAVWKSGRPFNKEHYPWQTPAPVDGSDNGMSPARGVSDHGAPQEDPTAGLTPVESAEPEVTAAGPITSTSSLPAGAAAGESVYVDFAHLKTQLPLTRVLDQLGLTARLKGHGAQKRCACPLHRGDARGRTFSVNLDENVFPCFDKACGRKGDVIDLWSAARGLALREAALDLVRRFGLEPAPGGGTEKRHG